MSTFDRVKKVVVEQLDVAEDEVTPQASFVEDLGADSLDVVELVMGLEEEFDVEIPDEDATLVKPARLWRRALCFFDALKSALLLEGICSIDNDTEKKGRYHRAGCSHSPRHRNRRVLERPAVGKKRRSGGDRI